MDRSLLFALAMLLISVPLAARAEAPHARQAELEAAFDIASSRVTGTLRYPVTAGETVAIEVGQLPVSGVSVNGAPLRFAPQDGILSLRPARSGTLLVTYSAVFRGGEAVGDRNFGVVTSTIDSRGISLTGMWHPRPVDAASWSLLAKLPPGYEAVSEAESVSRVQKDGRNEFLFRYPHPAASLSLVATDRWEVMRDRHGTVELLAYFFREDRELGRGYLASVKRYLDLYEKMLTPFPYSRFAVVENFLPTGYSMPTFTLLGQDVVRLPFITETSLGHEVLHQWFGSAVDVSYEEGNWCEGLTTYLADHWYDEQKGKGWEHRKQLLVNYAAYVHGEKDVPLRRFTGRTDLASRAIGYGKAAMVFHMLRTSLGDEPFFNGLRDLLARKRFQAASWSDLRASFERSGGKDLGPFFRHWVEGTGLPGVDVERLSVRRRGSRFEIAAVIVTRNAPLPLELPVTVRFLQGGTKQERVVLDKDRTEVKLLVDEEPADAVLDGDYDLARLPTADELPPVIARVLGDEKPLIIGSEAPGGAYQPVIDAFMRTGGTLAAGPKDADIRSSTVVILGADHPAGRRLFGALPRPSAGFTLTVRKNPWNPQKVVVIVHAASAEEARLGMVKVPHYGKYSHVAFEQGRNTDKRIDAGERGMVLLLREEPVVIDLSLLRKFGHVVEGAADKRIVYVGEYHDRFSHHNVQEQLIRALLKKDRSIAVGMEMFQRPFQGTLDAYIAGDIGEEEFLRSTEYFKRWGFDYNLYKPILDLCRSEKVPVVALNLKREITEKVSRTGMDSLTDDERKELPGDLDFGDEAYRHRIRLSFDQHKGKEEKDFVNFLQAQVLWDETMAESIDAYLKKEPGRRMVVIAGGGHLIYGDGIPKRAFRRNGLSYTIVLNDADAEPGIADYVILPPELDGMTSPKMQALFREEEGRLLITGFGKDSPAQAAGLQTGDALIALDGRPAGTLQDVKLALYAKHEGDVLLVTVARKRFFLGEKVMTVEVKL